MIQIWYLVWACMRSTKKEREEDETKERKKPVIWEFLKATHAHLLVVCVLYVCSSRFTALRSHPPLCSSFVRLLFPFDVDVTRLCDLHSLIQYFLLLLSTPGNRYSKCGQPYGRSASRLCYSACNIFSFTLPTSRFPQKKKLFIYSWYSSIDCHLNHVHVCVCGVWVLHIWRRVGTIYYTMPYIGPNCKLTLEYFKNFSYTENYSNIYQCDIDWVQSFLTGAKV